MDDPKRLAFVFAVDEGGGFGFKGDLPWPRNKADMARFRALTMGQVLCVGRETAKTLPVLPGRTVVVLTREKTEAEKEGRVMGRPVWAVGDLIGLARASNGDKRFLIGGGAQVLRGLNMAADIQWAHVSVIHGEYEADTRFSLHRWVREGGWFRVSKTEAEGVTFYDYARGAAKGLAGGNEQ